jgi:hypothetical protein
MRLLTLSCFTMLSIFSMKTRRFLARSPIKKFTLKSSKTDSEVTNIAGGTTKDSNLSNVRKHMGLLNFDAFLVPTDDPHMSEYTADYFARRQFISGFTGSAGSAIILRDKAVLFTDGRCNV